MASSLSYLSPLRSCTFVYSIALDNCICHYHLLSHCVPTLCMPICIRPSPHTFYTIRQDHPIYYILCKWLSYGFAAFNSCIPIRQAQVRQAQTPREGHCYINAEQQVAATTFCVVVFLIPVTLPSSYPKLRHFVPC